MTRRSKRYTHFSCAMRFEVARRGGGRSGEYNDLATQAAG
jgi:hypothetical protein